MLCRRIIIYINVPLNDEMKRIFRKVKINLDRVEGREFLKLGVWAFKTLFNIGLGLCAVTSAALRLPLLSRLCGAENLFWAFITAENYASKVGIGEFLATHRNFQKFTKMQGAEKSNENNRSRKTSIKSDKRIVSKSF